MKSFVIWLKKYWLIALYIILLPFVLVMLWQVEWNTVWQILSSLTWSEIGILLVLNLVIVFLAGMRWWIFIRGLGWKVPYLSVVTYRLAGFGLSFFTPGPQFGGEPLQILLLQRHRVPGTEALTSVMLERLLELLSNFAILIICVAVAINSGFFGESRIRWVLLAITIALLALPLGYLVAIARNQLLISRAPINWRRWRLVQWGIQSEIRLAETWHTKPKLFGWASLVLTLTWIAQIAEFGLSLRYMGQSFNLSQILTLLLVARLIYLSPVPGGLGVLELGLAAVTQNMNAPQAVGVSFGLLIHTRDVIFASVGYLFGVYYTQRNVAKYPIHK
jgi:uncharacterized protein (TIRG00374 family)